VTGRQTNLFVLTDGLGNHRVGETIGTVKARVAALQPGCAFRLRPVWVAAVPVEAGHAVLARVRQALARRHLHHDWFRTDCREVVEALGKAMGEVALLLERGPVEEDPPEPDPQSDADIGDPRPQAHFTHFDDELETARERVNLQGRSARKIREPWNN
jgi:hypothetical protein